MPALHTPDDLIQSYAWMKRMVLGLEDQSIPTLNRPAYGENEKIPLEIGAGWRLTEFAFYPAPVATLVADHMLLQGAVRWHTGTDNRALILPDGVTPFEEWVFITKREDKTPVRIRVTPDGYVHIPPGNEEAVVFHFRYPAPRQGG